jgi:hypothetical protein
VKTASTKQFTLVIGNNTGYGGIKISLKFIFVVLRAGYAPPDKYFYKNLPFFLFYLPLRQFRRFSFLVNADRVKRKLPSLLIDGSTTEKKSWNTLMRYRYRITQFKRQRPAKYNSITNRILLDLTDLEKAVNESKVEN